MERSNRKSDPRQSKHFSLDTIGEGVLAAIAANEGAAVSNAALIDLGGQIIVFDTFMTPQAASDLRQASLDRFGRTPGLAINSHYHNDHIWGNQVFAGDAPIISSARTAELIATAGREEFDWYSENSSSQLESLLAEYKTANDQQERAQMTFWIAYYEGLVEALPDLRVIMPEILFEGRLEFHGDRRNAELLVFEDAHTGSDAVLYLPDDQIIFMSDLLFVGCHPYLADGDPLQLHSALKHIAELDAIRYVPGHGPVGTRDDLMLMIEYVERCLALASEMPAGEDAQKEWIAALGVPEPFQDWQYPQFFQSNMQFLCQSANRQKEDNPPD